ncbi:MAG TPA: response regulator [Candidatus Nanopelagicales bacterium]|nr:response regulator [Candidatus Nanopelagicales bacterium]
MAIGCVLLVDDDADIRTIGSLALGDVGGWRTLLASSGQEAIELAVVERPDVVLLDVMMPEMDGPSVLVALQGRAETSAIPVIFMTAKAQKHELSRFRSLGATGVITKPFDPMQLAEEVRRIVEEG